MGRSGLAGNFEPRNNHTTRASYQHAERDLLTLEEVVALNEEADTRADRREGLTAQADVDLAYNAF